MNWELYNVILNACTAALVAYATRQLKHVLAVLEAERKLLERRRARLTSD